ncbi:MULTISPECIES: hypothetical protein [Flavobacteriaceae]|uniref:hypothetical protein n=1 Tax=Flavobacteriaceae TaxID=49546 RepID=UPI00386BB650
MKQAIIIIFLLSSITSFSQKKELQDIVGNWICTKAEFNAESSDSRIEKYLTLFKDSEFSFDNNEIFTLKKTNADNVSQIIIDSYWKLNKENQIIIDYKNPSSILKIVIETREEEIYFLLFDQTMSLKMERVN